MRALLLVDLQYDFMPGGSLPIEEGDALVKVANDLMRYFKLVVATQDYHPRDHLCFAAQHPGKKPGDRIILGGVEQVLWPEHCVQGTFGAALHRELDMRRINQVFVKGTDREIDSYSAFFDNGRRKATGLGDYLKKKNAYTIFIMGLATDYCVKYSALDARWLGFETYVIADGCRGVELEPGDVETALREMRNAGVNIVDSRAEQVIGLDG